MIQQSIYCSVATAFTISCDKETSPALLILTTLHTAHRNDVICIPSRAATPSTGMLLLLPARAAAALTAAAAALPTAGCGRSVASRVGRRSADRRLPASNTITRSAGCTCSSSVGNMMQQQCVCQALQMAAHVACAKGVWYSSVQYRQDQEDQGRKDQYREDQCSTFQYSRVHHSTVQYTVQYSTDCTVLQQLFRKAWNTNPDADCSTLLRHKI